MGELNIKRYYSDFKIKLKSKKVKYILLVIKILILFIILYIVYSMLFITSVISSSSMENTLQVNDVVIGFKTTDVSHNDIIIFRSNEENSLLVKRVIGVPGDIINIEDGYVYINGEKIDEWYLKEVGVTDVGDIEVPYTVPKNCYFVLGDNRTNSKDSRYWVLHSIKKSDIVAKALIIAYPFNRVNIL